MFDKTIEILDNLESLGVEAASKLAPWLVPILSAVVVGRAVMDTPFNWPFWLACITGLAIELSGVATLNTALLLWSYRADRPNDRTLSQDSAPSLIPIILAVICGLVYLVTALALTVVLKILPGFEVLAYGLFVLLALTSAVNLTLRRDHTRRTRHAHKPLKRPGPPRPKRPNEPLNHPPHDQTNAERFDLLAQANAVRKPKIEYYNYARHLRDDRNLTWPQVAAELGISESTAKRWYQLAAPIQQHQNGADHGQETL